MAQIRKLDVVTEIKSEADKFYGRFKDNMTELTKVYPEIYKSIQVTEGDGKSVGSIILWEYAVGSNPMLLMTKERITAISDSNRSITFEVIEGHPMDTFKTFSLEMMVIKKGNMSVVKWSLEFAKANEGVPDPSLYLTLLAGVTKKYDIYLLGE